MSIDNPYESPHADPVTRDVAATKDIWNDYSPQYNTALKTALLLQAVIAVLTALALDLGQMQRAFWVAFLCQWAMVWIILLRRPSRPTRLDLAIVRYGIVPLLIIVVITGPWLLRLLGVQT
jgi:hypothetical protein